MLLSVHPEGRERKIFGEERRGNFSNSILEYAMKVEIMMEIVIAC